MKLLLHVSNFCWKHLYPKQRNLGCKGRAFHLFLHSSSPSMGVMEGARRSFSGVCTEFVSGLSWEILACSSQCKQVGSR